MAAINKPTNLTRNLWASTGDSVEPENAKKTQGWVAEIPPYQFENWLMNRSQTALAHIVQRGIAEWDNDTEYQAGKSYVTGSNGLVYKALTTNTNNDPVTDGGVNWELPPAENTGYDNTASGLTAETSQAAIDEVVTKTLDVFSQQSLTTAGYQFLPGGLVIQWSERDGGTTAGGIQVFPIEFPNACFQVLITDIAVSQGTVANHGVTNRSTTGFDWYTNDTSNGNRFSWFAIGY